jgi:hypothetical protein
VRHREFVCELPTAAQDGAVTLNGSHGMGDRGIFFLKISEPHSFMTTYRMNLISAGSLSLDSTFKKTEVAALLIFLLIFPLFSFSPWHFACSFLTVLVQKNFVSAFAFFSFSPNTSVCVASSFLSFLF